MTAEVGVLTRIGVALAADSAVTVGPQQKEKVYTTAEKLFQLAEAGPVGVMVYGNGSLMLVPWETTIKSYRRDRREKTHATLEEYALDLVDFVSASEILFPPTARQAYMGSVAAEVLGFLRVEFRKALDAVFAAPRDPLTLVEVQEVFERVVREQTEWLKKTPFLQGADGQFVKTVADTHAGIIDALAVVCFELLPLRDLPAIRLLVGELVARESIRFVAGSSGVVVAGFGDKDRYPSLVDMRFYGVVAGRALVKKEQQYVIADDNGASIVPFADADMVHTFMRGIAPQLRTGFEKQVSEVFRKIGDELAADLGGGDATRELQVKGAMFGAAYRLGKTLFEGWDKTVQEEFVYPVMSMIGVLPKDELAAVAESLVNLTKLKLRVSQKLETVGGPIDVAVITKGDGFVWVKRKHYFSPELNPRVMARYYR